MTTFSDILKARELNPGSVHQLAVRRLLEAVGDRALTIVPDAVPVHEELKRRGYGRPFCLGVSFRSGTGAAGEESCECIAGLTLRQAGKLGKALGRAVVYSGQETGGEVCVLPLSVGLDRFGARSVDGLSRAYESARGITGVRFDCPPWGWAEALMECHR